MNKIKSILRSAVRLNIIVAKMSGTALVHFGQPCNPFLQNSFEIFREKNYNVLYRYSRKYLCELYFPFLLRSHKWQSTLLSCSLCTRRRQRIWDRRYTGSRRMVMASPTVSTALRSSRWRMARNPTAWKLPVSDRRGVTTHHLGGVS